MIVTDEDMGENAKYKLKLRDEPNYPGISGAFSITPEEGQGRAPVVIRARDSRVLDYDVPGSRELKFEVTALVHDEVVRMRQYSGKICHSMKKMHTNYLSYEKSDDFLIFI